MATQLAKDDPAGAAVRRGEVLHRILKLSNRLMAPFSTHLSARYKISLNEFRLLMMIGKKGSAASHELAELTGVNVMSVSRAVATLEKHGRITVAPDPANRRRKTLALTDEGQRLFAIMQPQTDKVVDYLFSRLDQDEIAVLDRILDTLIDTLEASDSEGRSRFLEETRPEDAP